MKYQKGQTLISKENPNNKRKVLGVCGSVIFLKDWFHSGVLGITEEYIDEHYTIEKVDWKPHFNRHYFFVTSSANVVRDIWTGSSVDQFRLKQKNVFETRELAEERLAELNS